MKLYSYTVFIDILGYSNIIENISNEDQSNEIFELLNMIELSIKEYFNQASESSTYKEYSLHYAFFSDCIILSFVPKKGIEIAKEEIVYFNQTTLEFIFTWIMNAQFIALIKTGFLLRGGISSKDIYWSNDNKVVGPALIEAYKLESKKASWARIILSEELSADESLMNHINLVSLYTNHTYLPHTLLLKEENESFYYYNYLGRMLARMNPNNLFPETMDTDLVHYVDESIPDWKQKISKEVYFEVAEITDTFLFEHTKIILENINHESEYIREKYINLKKFHNIALTDFMNLNKEFLPLKDLTIK